MSKKKILFVSQEMSPFLELTEQAKTARQLPQKMQEKGFEIRALMPRFGNINERRNRLHEVIRLSGINIVVNNTDNPLIIKVASIPSARMQVYFLDNEDFFHRKTVFTDKKGVFHADNAERSIFFCIGVLETVKKLGWAPDIIHCQGWMTSFIPVLLKTIYKDDPLFAESKAVTAIVENTFEGDVQENLQDILVGSGLKADDVSVFETGTCTNLTKGSLHYSDAVVHSGANAELTALINKDHETMVNGETVDHDAYAEFYNGLVKDNHLETVE
ncbi:MAG: starch synthase [Sphingobacteriales bacterium]|jgi:starch synthase